MPLTFDATLKDMGRNCPHGFLAAFDRLPTLPVTLLNVDLSAVTAAADLVIGLGEPLAEMIQIDFQSSAAAWKHTDLMVYHSLLHAQFRVPVHTVIVLLRPEAAHSNLSGAIRYAPRPGRGRMNFAYEVVRLWKRPSEELLAGDLGVTPLAMLGRLPKGLPKNHALASVAQRVVERLIREAPPEQAKKLLTHALLLTGLRVKRDVASEIFRGVHVMQESDTYLMILDEGREKQAKKDIILFGEERLGPAGEVIRAQLDGISDLERLERMARRSAKATSWQEIIQTP